ncbi:hypothetical protein SO3561_06488 [Streptomyces olivochromogenes]|uniref:Uncharacterized protein n=1 Tax=Streptomyces olivochromogenes TaxID=1963 RepID=A0A250VL94_STROL|nr:hypothetical protein SO3561_06488 [Streptomyces olivochromogenes]
MPYAPPAPLIEANLHPGRVLLLGVPPNQPMCIPHELSYTLGPPAHPRVPHRRLRRRRTALQHPFRRAPGRMAADR